MIGGIFFAHRKNPKKSKKYCQKGVIFPINRSNGGGETIGNMYRKQHAKSGRLLEKSVENKEKSLKTHQNEAFEGPGVAGNESSCIIYLGEFFFNSGKSFFDHFLMIFNHFFMIWELFLIISDQNCLYTCTVL